jgi:TolB-like protein/DNA-binding winged helix-turn-helix (wHTH) protein
MLGVVHQTYSFDGFTLDLTRGSLLRGNVELSLRPKSYATLKYLVENSGRLVSKDELVEAVWFDTAVTDNSLVQCLKEVRVALGDRSQRYIRTVPRRGYIFDEKVTANFNGEALYIEEVEELHVVMEEHNTGDHAAEKEENGELINVLPVVNKRRRVKVLISAFVIVASVAALSYYLISKSLSTKERTVTVSGVKSIAILPFKPLNSNEGDEYLGLGIADTLITRLGNTKEIVVRPTSAIQKYTSQDQDTLAAGREQRVDAVLEGSLQRSGDRLRVTVRLINMGDGSTLWAYKSDESLADIFTVQDIISEKVAQALAIQVSGDEKQRPSKRYTENAEAYQLYVKGVFLRNQMTEESLKRSIECFQKAIELDPQYALAYSGQASSYSPLAYLGYMPVKEAEVRNRALVTKALGLDDTLAEAHAAYGELKLFIEWDLEGADREFRRALELNPREQLSHLLYPDVLLIKGRSDEAVAMSRTALEMDPLSPRVGKALAWVYHLAGQYDQAILQGKATHELFPTYRLIYLGPSYEGKGMYDEAVNGYLETEALWGLPAENIDLLRRAYARFGWHGYWRKRLELMQVSAKRSPVPPIYFAEIYTKLGEKKKAMEWLEEAYNDHDMSLIFLRVDPAWKTLRPEPAFQDMLRRMHLDQ